MTSILGALLIIASLLLPLFLGIILSGGSISGLLVFPPALRTTGIYTSFSWPVWIGVLVFILLILLSLFFLALRHQVPSRPRPPSKGVIPWWGWLGAAITIGSWVLAWNRFPWFSGLQHHTFIPLWLGYILVINALCVGRSGTCLLREHTGFFIALFPLSAVFWWYFEYLNQIVGNWHYIHADSQWGPVGDLMSTALSFSTVLPAVLSTMIWLSTFPRLSQPFANLASLPLPHTRIWVLIWILGMAGLGALAIWPDYLYPLVWIAPLLVINAVYGILGRDTLFSPLQEGDWRPSVLSALAALICGFFWELWNSKSLAHWEYSIPWVGRFHLFEMPLLGYAGYLPFGLICLSAATLLTGSASTLERLKRSCQQSPPLGSLGRQ